MFLARYREMKLYIPSYKMCSAGFSERCVQIPSARKETIKLSNSNVYLSWKNAIKTLK